METLSDFIRRQAQEQRANSLGAAEIVLDTITVTPDELAGDLNLAKEFSETTGNPTPPAPMVQEYRSTFQKEVQRRRNGTILAGAPRLTEWIRDPENAALARDALPELSWFEGFARGAAGTAERSGERLKQMGNTFLYEQTADRAADRKKSFSEILEDQKLEMYDMAGNRIDTGAGPVEYLGAFARWVDARYADLIGTDDEASAAVFLSRMQENVEAIRAIPKSQIAQEFEAAAMVDGASLGEAISNFGSAFVSNPVGALSWALETAGESGPQLAAAMATTILTRNPMAGAVVGASGSYLTERYVSPAEFFEEKGLDLSKPEDIQKLLSDPQLMEDAANRGVIRGLIIGGFDAVSMGVAGGALAGNPVVEALAQGASQAILGSAGEFTARLAAGQEVDWNEVLAEGLAELATTPVDMGIAGRKFVRQRREAEQADETKAKLDGVMGAAGSSVLRNRIPDKFREFLDRATEGTNVESVFVDSDKFVEYFQELGVDPFAIADTLEGVGSEELRMATVSGGDVKIPVSTLATVVPGSGHEAFFVENSRFDPDDMSASMAAEFNERVEELRQETWEIAEEQRRQDEQFRTFEQEIYDTVVSELRAAGRSTNEATTAASLWVANYRTAAEDEGMTLDEYMARYPLPKVRGEIPQGMQARDVDALTRTLAEARARRSAGLDKRGPSLLEFISDYGGINDPGGELRARDAAVIKRGRGRKTLRLSRGRMAAMRDMLGGSDGKRFGMDDVALAAIEAGYMADDPVVIEYQNALREGREAPEIGAALLAAIDRELAGEEQYSSQAAVDEAAIQTDEAIDEIEEYLSRIGVGLDDPDDVIRAAVEADQDERRRALAQDEQRNLIVQHNLSAANLLHADKMRGLAVPSVAISNVDYPLDNFGEITLLGGPDLIDPRKDRAAKVFDADVYSPRYPTVRYKIAKPAMNKVWKRLGDVSDELGHVLSGELDNGEVERNGLAAFRDSSAVQLEFLRSTGRGIDLPQNTPRSEYAMLVPELAGMSVDSYAYRNETGVKDAVDRAVNLQIAKILDAAPDLDADEMRSRHFDAEGNVKRHYIEQISREIQDRRNPGVDRSAARYALRDAVAPHADEFAAWVENQFGDVIDGERIETQTASGNWKYLPHTLDNVVKILRKKLRDGEGFNYGVGSIRSTVANQFKSVSAIQKARGRLIPADDMKAIKDEVDNEFVSLAGRLGEYSDYSSGFGWLDTFSEQLKEMAERGPRSLKQYFNDLPDDLVQEAADFLQKLASMPTEYFEAKIQRAVDLSEFKAAVLPTDATKEVRDVLKSARVPVIEYDPKVTGARSAAIRRASGEHQLLFQRDVPSTETPEFKAWFGDSKVVDDQGKPLVVYHGTGADFEAFDPERRGSNTQDADARLGFFLSSNPDIASEYASESRGRANVIPAYVSLQYPLIVDHEGADYNVNVFKRYINEAIAAGNDGVIIKNTADGFRYNDLAGDTVVAFDPTQIKSVNNRGTFDPADARIMYQDEADESGVSAVDTGGGLYEIMVNGEKAGTISVARDGDGDFVSAASLEPAFQGRRIGHAAYDQIEAVIGRSLVPSPLGLSANGRGFWRRRFSTMSPDERADALRRSREAGLAYGIPETDIDSRLAFLSDGATYNQIDDVGAYNPFEQSTGRGPRGSIQFPLGGVADGETIINLFQSANLSTFLHESGHYFLANLVDRAGQGSAVAQERMSIVREWWRSNADGVAKDAMRAVANVEVTTDDVNAWLDNGTTGDASKDMAIDTGAHEQWARGFEQYLMEGKAPSIELRSAFEKFRAWLISVYRRITGLNVNVSDDLRRVFDRMLATDEEIQKAQDSAGAAGPVFTSAEAMGLTEVEYAAFLKLRSQSEDEAKSRLLRETMAPIKREQKKWFKDERSKQREAVEREVNAYRQYRAIEWMGNRRWLGDGKPESLADMRLSKDILVSRYGAGILKTLPRGQQTVYAVDGGLDPDDAAAWFGFASGDELVRAMETAPSRKEAIEAETDKRMRELHGDPLNDGSVEIQALDAIHSEKRSEWIAAELKAIAEVANVDVAVTAREARHTARQSIARMRVRDAMNSQRFLAAERKAAEEAARLGAMLAREGVWLQNAKRRIASKARAAIKGRASPETVATAIDAFNRKFETTETTFTAQPQARVSSKGKEFTIPGGERTVTSLGYNDLVAKLIEAKRRQLINHALYMESRKVADEVAKAERFVAKLGKRSHREKIAGAGRRENAQIDYLAAIDELLERYDFRRMSGRAEDRRGALAAFIQAMTAAGRENELAIPQSVLEPGGSLSRPDRHAKALRDAGRIPYKTLPVEELRGVVDSLKNIEHTALRWNEFIVNEKKREFTEAATAIADAIRENVGVKSTEWVKQVGLREGSKRGLSGYLATVRTATTILRKLDGRKDLGPTYELLKSDLDAAAYRELEMSREAADKLRKLYALYTEDEQRQMGVSKVQPQLGGRSFSKWNLIAMALNMGNEGNLDRLTNENARVHLRPDEVEAVKSMLDARDAEFVQGVWDLISSFRPEIAKRDRRVKGVEPEWVDPMPVTIGGVELRGGYYPIKYDGRHGGGRPSAAEGDNDILQSIMGGGYSSAHTKDGHLKARGAHVRQSLLLDTSVISRHLNEVIHDLTHSEPVVNTWKLLTDGGVERAFLDADLQDVYQQLKLWVQDAATGQVGSGSQLAQAFTYLRGGFAYSKLAFSVRTIALQPLGVMQSAVAVGKRRMASHMLRMMRNPVQITTEVEAKSRMMRMRRDTFNKDLMDAAAQSNIASPAGSKARKVMDDLVIPLGMAGMVYTQYYSVDVPTWAAAYEKGMDQFNGDDAKAVQYADMTVQRSQGSGIWTDRSGIERGTLSSDERQKAWVVMLTTLGSYFFAKMNMAIERTDEVKARPVTIQSAMNYALDMSLLFVGEALIIGLISEILSGGDDDDDDKSLAGEVLKESSKTFAAGLPVVRDAVGALQGFDTGTYGAILKAFTNPFYQASQGEVDKALVKSTINLTGMLLRLPSAQVNRVVDAAWREAEGDDVSPAEYVMGRQR